MREFTISATDHRRWMFFVLKHFSFSSLLALVVGAQKRLNFLCLFISFRWLIPTADILHSADSNLVCKLLFGLISESLLCSLLICSFLCCCCIRFSCSCFGGDRPISWLFLLLFSRVKSRSILCGRWTQEELTLAESRALDRLLSTRCLPVLLNFLCRFSVSYR